MDSRAYYKSILPVIQAWAEGKTVQRYLGNGHWGEMLDGWVFDPEGPREQYRILPDEITKAEYRTLNPMELWEMFRENVIFVHKKTGECNRIRKFNPKDSLNPVWMGTSWITPGILRRDYEYIGTDGTTRYPCEVTSFKSVNLDSLPVYGGFEDAEPCPAKPDDRKDVAIGRAPESPSDDWADEWNK